ncbi:MAG: major capsid protein [Alphaproteobacteria bacterium]|nr:major capsid protein [Alphaproteobacteria bacterium]
MPMLDIFSNDAFSVTSLTDAINKMPYLPGQAGQLGLFKESGVSTTSVMIEEKEGSLELIPTSPRGAPAAQNRHNKRKARSLLVPHLTLEDTILADEVQGVREFGSETAVQSVQTVVNDRLGDMAAKHDLTLENLRLGAIKGEVIDADGSTVLYNLFDEFNVTANSYVDFDLDNASSTSGAIKKLCHQLKRTIESALGAVPYDHIHAFCSASFFDALVTHSEVVAAYDRFQEGIFLRTGQARGQFDYAGIVFEEYRGGSGCSIEDGEARFFPVGVQGLFRQYNAPADFVETVNTIGLPRYAKQAVDAEFGRWVKLHTQANPLPICTRPKVLIKGAA